MNLLKEFVEDRQLAKRSANNYKLFVKQYEQYTGLSLEKLIEEADLEEEERIRWKHRTVKKRLIGFRNELIAKEMSETSVKAYVNGIRAIYRHFEIEMPPLPPLGKQAFQYEDMKFEDFLTKEEIQKAYNLADVRTQALMLLMATSGITRYDVCYTITVGDFITACKEYITTDSLIEQLNEIAEQDNVVPTFYLKRHKTKKWFYTFTTPECTKKIVHYLKHRLNRGHELTYESLLCDCSDLTLGLKIIQLNDTLKLGTSRAFRRLRPHMLRKFHASTLLNSKKFTEEEIDAMQGRSKDKIHNAYFRNDPSVLREQYIECIQDLTMDTRDFEYKELEKENKVMVEKMEDHDILIRELMETQKEMQRLME